MIRVALALIHREGRWFLQRRDAGNPVLPGLWEFPGGKIQEGEAEDSALRRELREELNWVPAKVEALAAITHAYPDRTVALHPFFCEGPGALASELGWGWFTPAEIMKLPIPEANLRLLQNPVFRESP